MTIDRRSLVKNTTILMISQLVSWALALLLTLYLPRYLGATNIGKYQLASSLWAIVMIFAIFGTDTYLVREIAKDRSRLNSYLSQAILSNIALFVISSLFLAIYISLIGYDPGIVPIVIIFGIANLIGLLSSGFGATLQGLEHPEYQAITTVITHIVANAAYFVAMWLGADLVTIAWISCIGAVTTTSLLFFFLRKQIKFRFTFDLIDFRQLLAVSFSFFLLSAMITIYQQVDVVVISWFLSEKQVGWYSVADRLVGSLMFIPVVFMKVFFPILSRLQAESPAEAQKIFRRAFELMFMLGMAVGLGMFAIARPLVNMLYGEEFFSAGPVLALRGVMSIATFENIILGIYLMTLDRQKAWVAVMAAATVATIPLDVLLIPLCQRLYQNGALGGAYSYLVTEFGMMLIGLFLIPKKTLGWPTVWYTVRTLIAGLVMAFGISFFHDFFILAQVAVGGIIFLALAVVFRLITQKEWKLLMNMLSSAMQRIFHRRLSRASYP